MKNQSPPQADGPRPFTFDRIFSRVEDNVPDGQDSQHDQMSVVDAAFEEGRKWGQEEMRAKTTAPLATVLENLAAQLELACSSNATQLAAHQRQSIQLAFTIASKLAPALIARSPRVEIEALIGECLGTHGREPHMEVHTAPAVAPELAERLDRLASVHGYKGKLSVVTDDKMTGEAVRIEWAGGSIGHDMAQTSRDIETLIRNRLEATFDSCDRAPDLTSKED